MAEQTAISWCDKTFNPWLGCTKVSPACANCYAEREQDHRHHRVKWGPNGTRSITSDTYWKQPLKWNREQQCFEEKWPEFLKQFPDTECKTPPKRPRVFCASLADIFEDWQGPIWDHRGLIGHVFEDGEWGFGPHMRAEQVIRWKCSNARMLTMSDVRKRLFALIDATPYLDWLLLTKRPENIRRMWQYRVSDYGQDNDPAVQELLKDFDRTKALNYRPNVWLGTSVENQEYANKRIPELLKCRDLSPVLFLSCEPLLGLVDLSLFLKVENERNNQVDGRVRLPIGDFTGARDRRDGASMEDCEERVGPLEQACKVKLLRTSSGGAQAVNGIPPSPSNVPESSVQRTSASPNLASSERTDSGGHDDQSQGRSEGQQQTIEPGVGDRVPAADSREQSFRDRSRGESVRSYESERKIDDCGCAGDSREATIGREVANDREQLRNCNTNSIQNRTTGVSSLWVICGGESGPNARPSHPDWFRGLRDQCEAARVPFHFKQWGEWAGLCDCNADLSTFVKSDFHAFEEEVTVYRIGKAKTGRFLDQIVHDAFPEVRR
jgi:protein gp37